MSGLQEIAGSFNIQIGDNSHHINIIQVVSGSRQWKDLLDKKTYLEDLIKYIPYDEIEKRVSVSKDLAEHNQAMQAFRDASVRLAEEILSAKVFTKRLDRANEFLKESRLLDLYQYMIDEAPLMETEQEILLQGSANGNNDSLANNAAELLITSQVCQALTRSLNPPANCMQEREKYLNLSIKSHRYFENLLEYGNFLFEKNRPTECVYWYNSASEKATNAVQRADAIANIGNANLHLHELSEAETNFKSALDIYTEAEKSPGEVTWKQQIRRGKIVALNNLSQLYLRLLKFDEARKINQKLVSDSAEDAIAFVTTYNFGLAVLLQMSPDEAEPIFDQALELVKLRSQTRQLNMTLETATIINSIGVTHMQRMNFKAAIAKFRESLKLARQIVDNDPSGFHLLAQALHNLGDGLSRTFQFGEAEKTLTEALTIREKLAVVNESIGFTSEVAQTLDNLGVLYIYKRDFEKAKETFLRSLAIIRPLYSANRIAFMPALANCNNNLGMAYSELKDYRSSEEHYEQALKLADELFEVDSAVYAPLWMMVIFGMTMMYYEKKERNRSLQYARLYMRILKTISSNAECVLDDNYQYCLEVERYWENEKIL